MFNPALLRYPEWRFLLAATRGQNWQEAEDPRQSSRDLILPVLAEAVNIFHVHTQYKIDGVGLLGRLSRLDDRAFDDLRRLLAARHPTWPPLDREQAQGRVA